MSPMGMVRMALGDLAAARGRAAIAAGGIAIGIWVLTLVVALGLGARNIVMTELVHELPLDTLAVVPKTLDMGLFKLNTDSLLGTGPLNAAARDRVAQLPHVAAVYPILDVPLPLGAQGGMRLFGKRLYSDLFMTGLPPELVRPEVGDAFQDTPGIIPVIVSDNLLDMYNSTIAPSMGSPQLTAESLVGFEFELVVGRSLMLGERGAKKVGTERARIVGASQYALRLGVSVPLATAERLLATYGDGADIRYTSILVRADSPENLPLVAQGVEAMGFGIDQTAQKTRRVLTTATLLASSVGALVLALAALNIAHSFLASLHARRRELAILRAVGASRWDMLLLVLTEAKLLGISGGLVGLGAAALTACAMDAAIHTWVPAMPFKGSLFAFPWWLCLSAVFASALAAVLGASVPAWQAARKTVAQGLID